MDAHSKQEFFSANVNKAPERLDSSTSKPSSQRPSFHLLHPPSPETLLQRSRPSLGCPQFHVLENKRNFTCALRARRLRLRRARDRTESRGESRWRTSASSTVTFTLPHILARWRSSPRRIPNSHRQPSASSTSAAEKLQDWWTVSTFIQMPVAATCDKCRVSVDGVKSSRVSFLPPALPSPSIGDCVLMSWQMCHSRWDDEAVNEGYISSQSIRPSWFIFPLHKAPSIPVKLSSTITLCNSTTVAPTWCGTRDTPHILHFSSRWHLKAATSGGGFFDIKKREREKKKEGPLALLFRTAPLKSLTVQFASWR